MITIFHTDCERFETQLSVGTHASTQPHSLHSFIPSFLHSRLHTHARRLEAYPSEKASVLVSHVRNTNQKLHRQTIHFQDSQSVSQPGGELFCLHSQEAPERHVIKRFPIHFPQHSQNRSKPQNKQTSPTLKASPMSATKTNSHNVVDVEMAVQVRTDRPKNNTLTIDNLSPSVWCMDPRICTNMQRKQPFSTLDLPAEMANLPLKAWSEFRDQLYTTWSHSRSEALKIFCIVFVVIFILVVVTSFVPLLVIALVILVVASASYGIHHQFIRGERIRQVVSEHKEKFQQAGYEMTHQNMCGTVRSVTIQW